MKETAQRAVTACRKVRFLFCASCDSTHKIEFAQQIHKNWGRVPRFLYKGRKNVSGGRGFSSAFDRKRGFDREAARKTIVFRQPQHPEPQVRGVFYSEQKLKSDISFSILHFQFSIILSRPAGYKSHAQRVRARPADFRTHPWDCPAD